MSEGSDDVWLQAFRARCRDQDCDYTSQPKTFPAARAAGRAHAINADHSVVIEDHPEVDTI